jgi:hypothetical protein
MAATHLDEIASTLATTRGRRSALGLLAGGALALLGANARAASNRRHKTRQQPRCMASGKTITVKKNSPRPAPRCCSSYRKLSPTTRLCCKPTGTACTSDLQCCQGVCFGTCVIPDFTDTNSGGSPDPICGGYGETCTATADCCPLQDGSHIPCNGGLCRFN